MIALAVIAGILSTAALLPQLYQLYTTRSAEDLSYNFLYMVILAKLLWIAYAWITDSMMILFFLTVDCIIFGAILALKTRYDMIDQEKERSV